MTKTTELKRTSFSYSQSSTNIHLLSLHDVKPLRQALDEFLEFSQRSTKELSGAVILDVSKRKLLSADQHLEFAKIINSNSAHVARNWTSIAFVNTFWQSMILRVGLWIRPMPITSKVFTTLDDAVRWSYKIYLSNGAE